MAFRYNLLKEYIGLQDPSDGTATADDIGASSHWVLMVIRLATPLSYSRQKVGSSDAADFSAGIQRSGDDAKLIITSDVLNLQVSRTKEGHTKALLAQLAQTDTNYLTTVLPGDWVIAWMVHYRDDRDKLIDRIKKNELCNKFDDGLKFVGRVHSLRKHMSLNPDGHKTVRYMLQAHGFHELDSSYLYSQFLADDSDLAQKMSIGLAKIGIDLNAVITEEAGDNAKLENIDNVHLLIPALLNILLGKGLTNINSEQAGVPQQAFGLGAKPPPSVDATSGGGKERAPQLGYQVPATVVSLVGHEGFTNTSLASYMDIFQVYVGIQDYGDQGLSSADGRNTLPSIDEDSNLTAGVIRYTGTPLQGTFLILPPAYDSRPIWEILSQYLNGDVNEMYTALKPGKDGGIHPTLVVRQKPFTTEIFAAKDGSPKATAFMSLPRWLLNPVMVRSLDLGVSGASRCNFVWVNGMDPNQEANLPLAKQAAINGPVIDEFDVAKNGLAPMVGVVAVNIINQEGARARQWGEMIADWTFGSQYTLQGTIECVGIQAPVAEGDNLELEGMVFHIEGISDQVIVNTQAGTVAWSTVFTVSHGLPVDDGSRTDTDETNAIYPTFKPSGGTLAEQAEATAAALDPGVNKDDD